MRLILIACALLVAAAPLGAKGTPALQSEVAGPADRKIAVTTWAAAKPKGVIVFGHGQGSDPAAYASLITRWQDAGYTVVAPLAVDSRKYADTAKFNQMTGFMARLEDLQAVRGDVAKRYPGKPVFLVGHSYGSLFSLYGAGASSPAGPLDGPPVAATIALSSPGAIPGLVTGATFAGVKGPLLVITGDADVVPGLVPDWKAHRLSFDNSRAGDKLLVVFKGGDHYVPITGSAEQQAAVAQLTIDFLDAHASVDASAHASHDAHAAASKRVAAVASNALYTAEHR